MQKMMPLKKTRHFFSDDTFPYSKSPLVIKPNIFGADSRQENFRTMINKFKFLFILTLCAGLFGTAMNISAQTGAGSLNTKVDKVIEFYEWAFETKFTGEERERLQAIKADAYRKSPSEEEKGMDGMITNYAAVRARNETEQARLRGVFVPDFIGQLNVMSGDAEAKLLLSIYERAQTATDVQAAGATGDISALAGKWVWARTGSGVVNGSTGAWVGGNGSRFTYQFAANGAVTFTGIMNVMQGGCSQQIFRSAEGRAVLSGDTLTIRWQPAKFTRDFSCDSANNYTKTEPAKTEKLKVRLKTDAGQKQLCIIGDECYSETK